MVRPPRPSPGCTAHADPASQWTAARKGPAFVAYSTNYLIDTDHNIIVDVDASRSNRTAEVGAMRKMIERTEERFGLTPDWIAADTAYGSSDNLVWLALKHKILPFIPVFDKGERTDGTFSRSDFTWDDENDRYICPGVKEMKHTRRTYSDPARNAPEWKARKYRAGMLIAVADKIESLGFDLETALWIEATELSRSTFHMCYIQCAGRGLAGRVINGNSLSLEVYSTALTAAAHKFYAKHGDPFAKHRVAAKEQATAQEAKDAQAATDRQTRIADMAAAPAVKGEQLTFF